MFYRLLTTQKKINKTKIISMLSKYRKVVDELYNSLKVVHHKSSHLIV